MNRTVIMGLAMFFALVGIALTGGENKAVAGHGCHGGGGGHGCDGYVDPCAPVADCCGAPVNDCCGAPVNDCCGRRHHARKHRCGGGLFGHKRNRCHGGGNGCHGGGYGCHGGGYPAGCAGGGYGAPVEAAPMDNNMDDSAPPAAPPAASLQNSNVFRTASFRR